ncbi:MAG: hypothetical protein H6747_10650 [Deltaproteobacteria bacterium]|nr:hypothetical protein [Deltaproteobacteria bacterium]
MQFGEKKESSSGQNAAPASENAAPAASGGAAALRGQGYDSQRAAVRPDGEPQAADAQQGQATEGAKPKTAQVILSARRGGSPFSREFWQDLNVGHCWVDVVKPNGRKDSWGYTANSVRDFPRYQPWKSVDGRVLHPDGSRGASGTLATAVDEDQLARGEAWANAAGSKYNLFGFDGGHSCATFAKGFYEEATGDKAPTGMFGAIIANPNDLSAAMNKRAEKDLAEKQVADADASQDGDGSRGGA